MHSKSSSVSSIVSLSDELAIRPLTSADIAKVCQLHDSLLDIRYPPSFFRQLLLHSERLCLIAYPLSDPRTIAGFVSASISTHYSELSLGPPSSSPKVQLLTLGVVPAYQRKGLARRLVHSVVRKLRDESKHSVTLVQHDLKLDGDGMVVSVHVPTENYVAQKFYSGLGLNTNQEVVKDLYRTSRVRDAYQVVGRIR